MRVMSKALDSVFERLAARDGMRDDRYFVGRKEALRRLRGCVVARDRHQLGCAWIHGARRIGKSSLAFRLKAQGEAEGSRVIWADASDIKPHSFEELLERVCDRADGLAQCAGESVQSRFERLARSAEKSPTVVVLDEFDRLAIELGTEEQGFLRRLAQENGCFSYVFLTRLDPTRLVEEVADHKSRLLGICQHERLGPLDERAARDLFRRVAKDLKEESLAEHFSLAWQRVGGAPICVMTLVQQLACSACEEPVNEDYACELIEQKRAEVGMHLGSLWRDLEPRVRALLLERCEGEPLPEADHQAALESGFLSRGRLTIPTWLVERGKALGGVVLAPEPSSGGGGHSKAFDSAERLNSLVYRINASLLRAGAERGFETTDEARRWYFLVRTGGGEQALRDVVDHLSKVLYEAARYPDGKRWRLPEELVEAYKKTFGYNAIVALRNFYDHDPHSGADQGRPSKRFQNAGEIYTRYCGKHSPVDDGDWLRIRDGLVGDVVRALEELDVAAAEYSTRDG